MTPTMALVWRQWRESQSALIASMTLTIIFAAGLLASQLVRYRIGAAAIAEIQFMGLAILCAVLGLFLSCNQGNPRTQTVVFAPEWWTLPISTMRIIVTLLAYRIAALCVFVGFAFATFMVAGLLSVAALGWTGETLSLQDVVSLVSVAILAYSLSQVLIWLVQPFHVGIATIAGTIPFGYIFVAPFLDMEPAVQLRSAAHPEILLPIAAIALPIAGYGVWVQRQGRWIAARSWRVELNISRPNRPFRSADEALRWYEWRTYARWIAFIGVSSCTLISVLGFAIGDDLSTFGGALLTILLGDGRGIASTAIILTIAGSILVGAVANNQLVRHRRMKTTWYPYLMPASNERLAKARCLAAGKASFIAMTAIVGALILYSITNIDEKADVTNLLPSSVWLISVNLVTVALLVWAVYLVGTTVYMAAALGYALHVFLTLVSTGESFEISGTVMFGGALPILSALIAMFVVTTAYGCIKRRLSQKTAITMLSVAPLAAIGAFLPVHSDAWRLQGSEFELVLPLGLLIVFLYPFAFWPTYLGWMRTR